MSRASSTSSRRPTSARQTDSSRTSSSVAGGIRSASRSPLCFHLARCTAMNSFATLVPLHGR